jgi:hypothetical protein
MVVNLPVRIIRKKGGRMRLYDDDAPREDTPASPTATAVPHDLHLDPPDSPDIVECGFRTPKEVQEFPPKRRVTFNDEVLSVLSTENGTFITTSRLCRYFKDTRSKLVPLSPSEKWHLYAWRNDLAPDRWRQTAKPRKLARSCDLDTSIVDPVWEQRLPETVSLVSYEGRNLEERKAQDASSSITFTMDLNRLAIDNSEENGWRSRTVRDSLDMSRLESKHAETDSHQPQQHPQLAACPCVACA